jgi:Galactose-3-O-sulfotransferase
MNGSRSLLVFVHINKTAGTTLRYILRSSYGARHCDVEPWHGAWSDPPFSSEDLQRVRKLYPRLASIAGHRISGYVDLEEAGTDFRYLTFLREPVALCASRFQYQLDYRKKQNLVFEEWIEKDWVRDAQTQRIGGTTDANDAIAVVRRKEMFVGLTERFDESIVLLQALRAPDLDIAYAPVNVAKSSDVAKRLLADATTRRMIVDANRADLELYEHVVREIYPAQQRDYGSALAGSVAAFREGTRKGYDRRNLALYGLKQRGLLKPAIRLYRGRRTGGLVQALMR